jgi:hypothetical protein
MTRKKCGVRSVNRNAAITSPVQEAHREGIASGQPTQPITAGDGQYELVYDEQATLTARFEKFHRDTPNFYAELVKLARRFRAKTGRTCGIQRLIEIVRFDIEMTSKSDEEFKINNDFAAFYSRLIMCQEPDLDGFFQLRRADEADRWIKLVCPGRAA